MQNKYTVSIPPEVAVIGGSTVVIDMGSTRIITDPTFDPPTVSRDGRPYRTAPASLMPKDLEPIDVGLVSHDQHPDNLDQSGRALLKMIPAVFTTPAGADRLGDGVTGLRPYDSSTVRVPGKETVTVTAVPALHGPEGAEDVSGPVTGFVIRADGIQTVYVSGDNASLDLVSQIAQAHPDIEVAVLFGGAARVPALLDNAALTMSSEQLVRAATLLGASLVVPAHCEGWTHYTEGFNEIEQSFAAAGMSHLLRTASTQRRGKL